MKTFFRFIFSKLFLKQFLLAVVIAIILFLVTVIGLRVFTHHGHTVLVPDVKGYNEMQMSRIMSDNDLRYVVIDSLYTEDVLPGTVYEQIPKAGSFVKKDRKIFLVMNAKQSEKVMMPSLKNVSLRQAKVMLSQNGLKLRQIVYVSSEYKGLVIGQLLNDTIVTPGTMVRKWSEIDLQVGRGLGSSKIQVPFLRGKFLVDAKKQIQRLNLNGGAVLRDETITEETDLDSAIVWKQYPQPEVEANLGKAVDLWITMDTAVVYAADSTLRPVLNDNYEE